VLRTGVCKAPVEGGVRGMVLVTLGVLTTTAQQIQGRPAREYLGIVSGDSIVAIHRTRHRFRDRRFGIHHGRRRALSRLARCASALGATVVVGIKIDYVAVGAGKLLVTATGTAVRL
jgi:uncharacterized protein YbjQ (UPF0145 family)